MLTSPLKRDPQIDVFTKLGAGNWSAILQQVGKLEKGKFGLSLEYGDLPMWRKGMAGTVRDFPSGLSCSWTTATVIMMWLT